MGSPAKTAADLKRETTFSISGGAKECQEKEGTKQVGGD
jgi:hypothetical protein